MAQAASVFPKGNAGVAARRDAREKVTGRARYTGDLVLPGMLVAKLVRSPLPHARILRVDTSRALAMPGVAAVLTPDEVGSLGRYGHAVEDRPVLAQGTTLYIGEPVAAVAAVDPETARLAAEAVDIEYEPLTPVLDMDTALDPAAPALHLGGNVCSRTHLSRGDMAAAWQSAKHIYEGEWTFPSTYQYAMEPHTVLATWRGERLMVWSSAQHPFVVRQELSKLFGLPLASVRVQAPFVGGGFGSKSYTKHEPVLAALAKKAGKPVRLEFSVSEAMLTNRRHNAKVWIKTGVDATGHIVAREARAWLDTGAFADNGPRVAEWAARQLSGTYGIPAYDVEALAVYTNKGPAGSYRAIGQPQTLWAVENQLDQVAEDLGMDPLELRRINLAKRGQVLHDGDRPVDADLAQDLSQLRRDSGYGKDSGVSCGMTEAGASPVAVAIVRWFADRSATVQAASGELGQGARTVMAQIAAQTLSIPVDRISVVSSDTDSDPFDRSTGASRSTTVMGRAVQEACRDALSKAVDLAKAQEIVGVGYSGPFDGIGSDARPVMWEIGMAVADADVDLETGEIRVTRYTSLADLGKAINPALVEGQEEGGTLQALGHTLYESLEWSDGMLINGNLIDYRVPTFDTIPQAWDGVIIENADGPGPYGSTGVGEGAMMPVAGAVAGALRRKYGLAWTTLPLTPERVWTAMQNARKGFMALL